MVKNPIEQGYGMLKKVKGFSPLEYILDEHAKELICEARRLKAKFKGITTPEEINRFKKAERR